MRNLGGSKRKTGAVNSKKLKRGSITFASSLEAYTYDRLKDIGVEFRYEGESFEILPAFKYDGCYLKSTQGKNIMVDQSAKSVRAITYTPDFVSHEHKFIIETKGFVPSQHSFHIRFKLFLMYLRENGMGDYAVYIPRNQMDVKTVVNDILSTK